MRISDWSSDVCSSDLVCWRPSAQVTVRRPGLPSSGFLYFVLAMPLPEQVGKPPPNASCRQSFVMGGTQAPYCVGPPGLERHRTTSQAQVLSDAIAGADDTDAPTRAAANARFKAFIYISLLTELHSHINERQKGNNRRASG